MQVETPRHCRIERPQDWTLQTVPADIAERPRGRSCKCSRIDERRQGFSGRVFVGISGDLIRALVDRARQRVVDAADDIDWRTGGPAIDSRYLPVRRYLAKRVISELWCLCHRREVEQLTAIGQTVSTIEIAVPWLGV